MALTGGIGSGKSTALAYLGEIGAATVSSDHVVHALYDRPEVVGRVRQRYGEAVILPQGGVNRSALAAIVFSDQAELHWLEELLHPFVRASVSKWIEERRRDVPRPELIAVEVPLLFETGFEARFDFIMLITAPTEVRRQRLTAKLTEEQFRRRLAEQMPEEEKIARSDFVFVNDGSRQDLREFVRQTAASIIAGEGPAAGGGAGETTR